MKSKYGGNGKMICEKCSERIDTDNFLELVSVAGSVIDVKFFCSVKCIREYLAGGGAR